MFKTTLTVLLALASTSAYATIGMDCGDKQGDIQINVSALPGMEQMRVGQFNELKIGGMEKTDESSMNYITFDQGKTFALAVDMNNDGVMEAFAPALTQVKRSFTGTMHYLKHGKSAKTKISCGFSN